MDDIIIHYIREHNKNNNTNINNKYERICILEENLLKTCLNKNKSDNNDLCNIYEKIYFDCKKFKNRKIKNK
tara:strand:+ start:132 stop:347 length:216 start_codon:yes stop_codon:yes gene_type:complete